MGAGQYKDDRLPQYSFKMKEYLVKANPRDADGFPYHPDEPKGALQLLINRYG